MIIYKKFYVEKFQEAYQSLEERSEKLEILIFSILFNFRNYVSKPNLIADYSKNGTNNFEDFEEEKNVSVKAVDPELDSIRLEIKNFVEDLKGIFTHCYLNFLINFFL